MDKERNLGILAANIITTLITLVLCTGAIHLDLFPLSRFIICGIITLKMVLFLVETLQSAKSLN